MTWYFALLKRTALSTLTLPWIPIVCLCCEQYCPCPLLSKNNQPLVKSNVWTIFTGAVGLLDTGTYIILRAAPILGTKDSFVHIRYVPLTSSHTSWRGNASSFKMVPMNYAWSLSHIRPSIVLLMALKLVVARKHLIIFWATCLICCLLLGTLPIFVALEVHLVYYIQ